MFATGVGTVATGDGELPPFPEQENDWPEQIKWVAPPQMIVIGLLHIGATPCAGAGAGVAAGVDAGTAAVGACEIGE